MHQQKTILLIEDDADIRNSLGWLLSLEGYATLSAVNGKEAIDLLQNSRADLVILDLMMPVMSGAEFLERLRAGLTPAPKDLPVIILSAAGDVITSKFQSKETLLKKPVDIDRLLQAVVAALGPAK